MPRFALTLRLPPGTNVDDCVRERLDAGFEAVALEPPLHLRDADRLVAALGRSPLASLRLFLPYPKGLPAREPSPFRLGSLDADERRQALRHGSESIAFADRQRIPRVLLPVAPLDGDACGDERQKHLSSLRSTLDRLLALADGYAVRLGLTPTTSTSQLPSPAEVEGILREFEGAPLDVWLELREEGAESPPAPLPSGVRERVAGATLFPSLLAAAERSTDREELLASVAECVLDAPRAPVAVLAAARERLEELVRGPPSSPFV